MTKQAFRKLVWQYYREYGRHALPWRLNLDPYAIAVSEIMLQQTQVERVIPKFEAWLKEFSTWEALAKAPLPAVLKMWQGLGYNRRALNLQRCAQVVVREYSGTLPREHEKLLALPGIGPYTAGAVRAFAFNEPVVIIETNIRAVYIHHFFGDHATVSDEQLLPLVEKTLDEKNPREWYWALMDYGSYLKKITVNPARRSAHHARQSTFEGSHRQVRGAIVRALTTADALTTQNLRRILQAEGIAANRIRPALSELAAEGFIHISKSRRVTITAKVSG